MPRAVGDRKRSGVRAAALRDRADRVAMGEFVAYGRDRAVSRTTTFLISADTPAWWATAARLPQLGQGHRDVPAGNAAATMMLDLIAVGTKLATVRLSAGTSGLSARRVRCDR